jgi:uncharacterized SAM-binding protein YcdF (DUF218 family)
MRLPLPPVPYAGKKQRKYTPWTLFLAPVFLVAALMARCYGGAQFAVLSFFALCFLSVLYGAICLLCRHSRWSGQARVARQVVDIVVLLFLLSFIAVEGLILSGAHSDPDAPADCVLVLGAGLHGETPSLTLASRLDAALRYLNRYPDVPVVVSGGQGPGESISEAEAMYRWLAGRGIDPDRIIREDRSTNTTQNVQNSIPLMPERTRTVAVVTNEFHLFRARRLLRASGLTPIAVSAPTPLWYLKPTYYFREFFSVIFMGV